jgi:peptidoglycan/xylan/chitin deacetylase (PgdA/CDA1 family)
MKEAVNILMYHSIAEGPAPLAIPATTFRAQLDVVAECGLRGVSLSEYIRARHVRERSSMVVLTFDDGYKNFADIAVPEIRSRGWNCTVFLPTDLIGNDKGWNEDGRGPRQLIDWSDAAAIASAGIEIGSHGLSHADLTRLDAQAVRREATESKQVIEERTGCSVTSFAAPHGRTNSAVRQEIAKTYRCAVGTRLAAARPDSDVYDLPRIEMWYFRDAARWRAYLRGATGYFSVRQVLRQIRRAARRVRL